MIANKFNPVTIRSRQVPIEPHLTALISVDMQNNEIGAEKRKQAAAGKMSPQQSAYFFDSIEKSVLPNQILLHQKTRELGIENIYVVIESLTTDGRDRGIDHKVSDIHNPPNSFQAAVIDEVKPHDDDVIIKKTASGPFGTTNIDYVLQNLGVRYLIVFGILADQCVENTVRAAADIGYLVTVVPDGCSTYTPERHEAAISSMRGYARTINTAALLEELSGF
jgi:nicotinamidase-related amidase